MQYTKYNAVAISLHWLIAFFLLGLLSIGKYMTSLEETDALRYALTQWHKSFGIVVLILTAIRVLWRLGHHPPALPPSSTGFERFASGATHFAMYLLMVVIPVSGWAMVSVSPLNINTELFGLISWPHLSFLADSTDKETLAELSHTVHVWMANSLLALIVLHVAAALFHQFVKRDRLISRMMIGSDHRHNNDLNHGLVFGMLLAAGGGLFLFDSAVRNGSVIGVSDQSNASVSQVQSTNATVDSFVGFKAVQLGESVTGRFETAQVQLRLNADQLNEATLTATVETASVNTGDSQLDGTVVTADWFASDDYPHATFNAISFVESDNSVYIVVGELAIKGNVKRIEFELMLVDGVGKGEFVINRSDFKIGDGGQDEFVDPDVTISFIVPNGFIVD